MLRPTELVVCVGVLLFLRGEVQGRSFIEQPESTVVRLGGTAIFECRAFGHSVYWYIDDEQVSQQHFATRGVIGVSRLLADGSWDSTLSVSATQAHMQANNNSMVECAVFTFGVGETKSRNVSVRIVGILKAPKDFRIVHRNGSCIRFSWTPPVIIPTFSISGFIIYVNNMHTDDSEELLVQAHLNDYSYIPIIEPSPCHVYEFHITITHEDGEGERSEGIEGSFVTEPNSIQAGSVQVTVGFFLSEINFTFTIKMNDSCNVDNYTVHLYSEGILDSVHTGLLGSSMDESDITILTFAASVLHVAENMHYTVVITAVNDIGHANSSGMIHASTFDVQNVTAEEETPGILCLTCYFAGGSDATGCSVRIQSADVVNTVTITRAHTSANNTSVCIDVIEGVYNISAYDLEKDGERSQLPAVETSKSVEGGASTINSPTTEAKSDNIGLVVSVSTLVGALLIVATMMLLVVHYVRRRRSHNEKDKTKGTGPIRIPADPPVTRMQEGIETKRNKSYVTHVPKEAIRRNLAYETLTVKAQQTQ